MHDERFDDTPPDGSDENFPSYHEHQHRHERKHDGDDGDGDDHGGGDGGAGLSKSRRKRDARALVDLGARLAALGPAQLDRIPLPADLRAAVDQARGISARGGHKRQLKFIGKQLRQLQERELAARRHGRGTDQAAGPAATAAAPDTVGEIAAALDRLSAGSRAATREQHRLERLTAGLLAQQADTMSALLQAHPQADRQHVRQLARSAAREQAAGKPPRARRQLFRYLRDLGPPATAAGGTDDHASERADGAAADDAPD